MEDKEIVSLYWARLEEAISETTKKYGRYCHYIAFQILQDESDAEEIVNDTWWKAWNTMPPNRPDPLKPYVGMITRQLSFNAYEAKTAHKRGGHLEIVLGELAECIPDTDSGQDIGESIALRDALDRFLWSLPAKTRIIFLHRYWYASSLSEIAREYGMTENHVGVLLFNTRKKLKDFLSKEGFGI